MKRLLSRVVGVIVLCVSVDALAQGAGSPSNPLYERRAQGNFRSQYQVTCVDGTAVMSASSYDNPLSITFQNVETTSGRRIGICPRTAAPGACDAFSKYAIVLNAGESFTTDMSAGGDWSCDGIGNAFNLNVYVEQWYKMAPNQPTPPVPTSIPTPTAGPTPTPVPT